MRHRASTQFWRFYGQLPVTIQKLADKNFAALITFILVALTMLCSCAHRDEPRFSAGTGDAGEFILRQAVARGGQPITTNGLPAITGFWRYSEDQYGVMIRLSRHDYDAVEAMLRQPFGPPRFGPTFTTDGGKLGGYRLTPKGAVFSSATTVRALR